MKSLKDLALNITEAEYRQDGCLHYSTLATYARGGFNCLPHLFDRKESPSLLFGSCVDTLLTDGEEAFNNTYMVADFPSMPDALVKIVNELFSLFKDTYTDLMSIPTTSLAVCWDKYDGRKWKDETKARFIIENGNEYYRLKYLAGDKIVIGTTLYNEVLAAVNTLKESPATKWYFATDNPFDGIERIYQPKFKSTFEGLDYSCMMDLVVVDHNAKTIYPCDLKTSSHEEYDFFKSFIDWSYSVQGRQYFRILEDNIKKDDYFKDFTIMPYRFIVINKRSLNPLVWEFEDTFKYGTLYYGKNNQIECRDPFDLGKELTHYLNDTPKNPDGVEENKPNSLAVWLKTL